VEVREMELFFELLLAALAVFGLWCLLRLVTESLCSSQSVCMAVEVLDSAARDSLGALLREARANLSYRRGSTVVVFYDRALLEDGGALPENVACICRRYGARCYIVDGAVRDDNI
jgi:hypothetical protein